MGALRDGRAALLARPARAVAQALGEVGARFLDGQDPLRREALGALSASAGFSAPMAGAVLDGMAADWTAPRLLRLLDLELAGGAALDGWVDDPAGRRVRALGPPLAVHICAGTVPGVGVTSMLRSLLVRSAVLLKPGRGDEALPSLFLRALGEADPELAGAARALYWQGGSGATVERVALDAADLVVVHGGDEAVRAVRALVRGSTPVIAHPHRVGFGVVGPAALVPDALVRTADLAARAVALYEQRGCVSPHLFYVMGGGEGGAERFAGALARALAALELEWPQAPVEPELAAARHQLRGTVELLALSGRGRVWPAGGGEEATRASWTVVLDPDARFEPSCLGRTVRVKAVEGVDALLDRVAPFRRHLQTIGVAGVEEPGLTALAEGLARLGGGRVAALERAPWPAPWWLHDGMEPLRSLVRWSEVEP